MLRNELLRPKRSNVGDINIENAMILIRIVLRKSRRPYAYNTIGFRRQIRGSCQDRSSVILEQINSALD